MNWLLKKLKKYIGEHKFLYLVVFFLLLWQSTCSNYQWNIVHIERKAPGKEPETEKHDPKLTVYNIWLAVMLCPRWLAAIW